MRINLRNALMAGKRLPYDAEVEYLESTGTQYIDTGVVPDATTEFIVTAAPTVSTEQFMGAINASANRFHFSFYSGGYIRGCIGVNQTNMGSADTSFHSMSLNAGGKVVTMDGVSYSCNWEGQIPAMSLWLFGRNSDNADYVRKIKCKISSCKIYQSNILVRDFIPVRKGAVGYLYDRVSGKLFGNAGTGDFVVGPDVVPVEYIESHGTEYIDTGVDPAQDLPFECTFSGQSTSSGYGNVFGSRYSSRIREYQLTCYNGGSVSIGSRTEYLGFDGGEKNTVSYNGINSVNINGTTSTIQTSTCSPTTGSIVLFGVRQNGTVAQLAQGRIYGVSFGTAANFLPVRVGTDATSWEGAMMDVLTRRIYRNAGTGAFTYGNDLKYPIPA